MELWPISVWSTRVLIRWERSVLQCRKHLPLVSFPMITCANVLKGTECQIFIASLAKCKLRKLMVEKMFFVLKGTWTLNRLQSTYCQLKYSMFRYFDKSCQLIETSASCADSPCMNNAQCVDSSRSVAIVMDNVVTSVTVSTFCYCFPMSLTLLRVYLGLHLGYICWNINQLATD